MTEEHIDDTPVAGIEELVPVADVIEVPQEVQPEPTVEEVIPEPVIVPVPKPQPEAPKPMRAAPVSGKAKDDVLLANCVYMNKAARKSLSVHHLQRRLAELGYPEAYSDKDGWYGDLTKAAVEKYQKDNKLSNTGIVDEATFTSIFSKDPLVNPII